MSSPDTSASALPKRLFCTLVLFLALFQFSENTADPDLWGHVVFGQHLLKTGVLERAEPFSWTANGNPWINHEIGSELALGGAHVLLGGSGILLLKVLVGLTTFGIALGVSRAELRGNAKLLAWAFGALAVVEISYGFAARPQIFTALFLACELWLLLRIDRGRLRLAFLLPILFVVWINTHGGALAGIVLLWFVTGACTVSLALGRHPRWCSFFEEPMDRKSIGALWLCSFLSTAALLLNPYGAELIRWLIGSVLWLRPEIEEWNPAKLGWDHGAFFGLVALTIISFGLTRRRRSLWQMAVCGALMVLALRSVRHTPLFSIAALAFVPAHVVDVLNRFRSKFARIEAMSQGRGFDRAISVMLLVGIAAVAAATAFLHKERFWTMEVPRSQYPTAAMNFIKDFELNGKLLVFFDWGEMAIWELPKSPPSVDGRLDTCYPRDVITAHWRFYNAEPFDEKILPVGDADVALLPANLAGAFALAKQPGWKPAYVDDLAVILVRDVQRYPRLQKIQLPNAGPAEAVKGRAAFSNKIRA